VRATCLTRNHCVHKKAKGFIRTPFQFIYRIRLVDVASAASPLETPSYLAAASPLETLSYLSAASPLETLSYLSAASPLIVVQSSSSRWPSSFPRLCLFL
jgi:hypothetical protein